MGSTYSTTEAGCPYTTTTGGASKLVAIGTVAVGRIVGAAVYVVTGIASTRGWSHELHIGSDDVLHDL